MVNELYDAGHIISEADQRRTFLRGLIEKYEVLVEFIRITDMNYTEAVAHFIIERTLLIQKHRSETALTTRDGHPSRKGNERKWLECEAIVLSARNYRKCKWCYYRNKSGHLPRDCFNYSARKA